MTIPDACMPDHVGQYVFEMDRWPPDSLGRVQFSLYWLRAEGDVRGQVFVTELRKFAAAHADRKFVGPFAAEAEAYIAKGL